MTGDRALQKALAESKRVSWRKNAMESIALAVVAGFVYDPGHSDLDDEQPINVRMTLGDYRRARMAVSA